jgi:hypothetical protein
MKIPRWAQVLIGVGIVMVFLGIGAIVAISAYFSERIEISDATAQNAEEAFEKIRQRFAGKPPLVVMKAGESVVKSDAAPASERSSLETLHVLAWDPDEDKLVNVSVPWWIVRMKSGPIRFSTYASGWDDNGVSLQPEDIERYGAGIVLDVTGRHGERALLWTE